MLRAFVSFRFTGCPMPAMHRDAEL